MSDTIATPAAPAAAPTSTPPSGASAPAADWRASLPDDLKGAPSLQDIKDIPSLAKSYVHAQSRMGSSISVPKDDATPEELSAFYTKLGRPSKAEEYKFTEVALPEGSKIDEKLHKDFTGIFHQAGLSQKQADTIRTEFLKRQAADLSAKVTARNTVVAEGQKTLMLKWGDKFEANARVAKQALAKFATPELIAALEETGAGSDPRVVEAFHNIGLRMQEDNITPNPNGSSNFSAGNVVAARDELARLTKDEAFQKSLHDRWAKDHKEVAAKWLELHKTAASA